MYEGDLLRAPREQLWSAPEVPGALLQTLLAKFLQHADFPGCLLLRLELRCASQQTCSSNTEMGQPVARTFHEFLPGSELFLIPGARHFVQLDEPEQVARLILAMPGSGSTAA